MLKAAGAKRMKFDYVCPAARDRKCGYAFNRALGGLSLAAAGDVGVTVLFFESNLGWNGAGGPKDLPAKPRHSGGDCFGFAAGYAKWIPRQQQSSLVWQPPPAHGQLEKPAAQRRQ
jgi:hypothetical protein